MNWKTMTHGHFQQNIIDFRAWMAERGYGDKPLMVSEYGILMPAEYGFPPESWRIL